MRHTLTEAPKRYAVIYQTEDGQTNKVRIDRYEQGTYHDAVLETLEVLTADNVEHGRLYNGIVGEQIAAFWRIGDDVWQIRARRNGDPDEMLMYLKVRFDRQARELIFVAA